MARYVGAIDQGTTSTRFILFDRRGKLVAAHQLEHRQVYPRPGWVEHDPLEIWSRTQEVVRGAMEKARASAGDLAAVGITNQRETTLVWDRRTGAPLAPAVVWQDTRTDRLCRELAREGGSDRFREKTGLPISTYFSGPKIRWLLDHVEGLRPAAERGAAIFGTVDSWLVWNLTGGPDGGLHLTDVTNASRTLVMNLSSLDWDPEILEILGIPRSMLPAIRSSAEVYGTTRPDGCFGGEVPIAAALGDQQAALYGQTCYESGEAKNTYGTGAFVVLNTGPRSVASRSGLLTTVGYRIDDEAPVYALEGSIAVTGALVQWLRDNLGLIARSEEVESLAATVPDNGGVYFVPAFSGLFAPYWRSDARGVIVGLTRFAGKGHIARAALEATAYQTREVLEAMHRDSGVRLDALKVDGGMVANDLLMQFQADVLGVPVLRPRVSETTALGAAYAAGRAVGFWRDEAELRAHWEADRIFEPGMEEDERERLYARWRRAVEKSFGWAE